MRCPTCRKDVPSDGARLRPFCSERCKLVDLGRWLDGDFVLPGEDATLDELDAAIDADEAGDPRGGPRSTTRH